MPRGVDGRIVILDTDEKSSQPSTCSTRAPRSTCASATWACRTKYYGVGILAGEATRGLVKDLLFREVDRVKVKGREGAISVYQPLGQESAIKPRMHDELKLWNQTLRAFRVPPAAGEVAVMAFDEK